MQLGVANVSDLAGSVSVTVIVFDNFRVYWQGLIPRGFRFQLCGVEVPPSKV